MKALTLRPFLAAAIVIVPFLALYHWQVDRAVAPARQVIGSASGLADILRQGEQIGSAASQQALFAGDSVRALDVVRLVFGEGSVVEMAPGATLLIEEARLEDGRVLLRQQAGRVSIDTTNPQFRLEAPTVALSVNTARFSVELADGGDAYVKADQGMVYGSSEGENVTIAAGETLRTGVGQRAKLQLTTPVVMPPPPPPPPRTATPTVTPVPPTQPPIRYHVIVAGDTLTYLANLYGVSVDAIVRTNNITDPNMLHIGDKLIIPPAK